MKEEFIFNNFKYTHNPPKFEVSFDKETPEFLFKYYSNSKYSFDSVINNYLYASHPFELNDGFDSSYFLLHTSNKIKFSEYEKLLQNHFESKEELEKYYLLDLKRLHRGFIQSYWKNITAHFGIISLTSSENNLLMWPHYTNENGFQIKLKFENLYKGIEDEYTNNFKSILPINYSEKLTSFDISKYTSHFLSFLYVTNIKTKDWKYEDEWRIIIGKDNMGIPLNKERLSIPSNTKFNHENRYIKYDSSIIEEITLGYKFFNQESFEIEHVNDGIIINPKKDVPLLSDFIEYIYKNVKDNLYQSGVKQDKDKENNIFIKRNKEKIKIIKLETNKYKLIQTGQHK